MNDSDEKEESTINLKKFLESLWSAHPLEKNQRYYTHLFHFYHDVLCTSNIPSYLDFSLWGIFFMFVDLIIISVSIPTDWFIKLNPNNDRTDIENSVFLFEKIKLHQVSIAFFVVTAIIVVFQWISFAIYNPIHHFAGIHSKLLRMTYINTPYIIFLILGILFGSHVITNIDPRYQEQSGTIYSVAISLCFIAYAINVMIFNYVTAFALSQQMGHFACWTNPYGVSEILYFFLVGTFLPFKNSEYNQYLSVISGISMFYGFYILAQRSVPAFQSLTAIFFELKCILDTIVFGFYSLLTTWIKFDTSLQIDIGMVLNIASFGLAFRLLDYGFTSINNTLSSVTADRLSFTKINTKTKAMSLVRYAITFASEQIINIELLKSLITWRFSPDLIPEIVRIALIIDHPLDDIYISKTAFGPLNYLKLKFFAFQVNMYQNFIAKDGDPVIEEHVTQMQTHIDRYENLVKVFWTNNDYEHLNILNFGKNLQEIYNQIKNLAMIHPYSERIAQMAESFNSMCPGKHMPIHSHTIPFERLVHPADTLYAFLKNDSTYIPDNPKKWQNSLQRYHANIIKKGTRRQFNLFFVYLILTMIGVAGYSLFTNRHMRNTWFFYVNVTQVFKSEVAMTNVLLSYIDKSNTFPSPEEISKILGIDSETAGLFRSPIEETSTFIENMTDVLSIAPNELTQVNRSMPCQELSLSLILNYVPDQKADRSAKRCFMMFSTNYATNLNKLGNIWCQKFHDNLYMTYYVELTISLIYLVLLVSVYTIICIKDKADRERVLHALRKATALKPNREEHEQLDFSFRVGCTAPLIFLMLIGTLCQFLIFIFPTISSDKVLDDILNTTRRIAGIASFVQSSLAVASFSIHDKEYESVYHLYISSMCNYIFNITEELTTIGISKVFESIPPLSKWTLPTRDSFSTLLLAYSQDLKKGNLSIESFEFLISRLWFKNNISILIDTTMPLMVESAHLELQSQTTQFSWAWLATLLYMACIVIGAYFIMKRKESWYIGACSLLMKEDSIQIREILEGKKHNYVYDIPLPFVIIRKDRTIQFTSDQIAKYTRYKANQLVDQDALAFFNYQDQTFKVDDVILQPDVRKVRHKKKLVILNDITHLNKAKEQIKSFNMIIKSGIHTLPLKQELVYIEMRILNDNEPHMFFEIIEKAEEVFGKSIKRLQCGASFYVAKVSLPVSPDQVVDFLKIVTEGQAKELIIAITVGEVLLISLTDNESFVIACGTSVRRAHDCMLMGLYSHFYIDSNLLNGLDLDSIGPIANLIFPISGLTKPAK